MTRNTQLRNTFSSSDFTGTVGGNGNGEPCVIPFIFEGQSFDRCIVRTPKFEPRPFCSVTSNYDRDGLYGYCTDTAPTTTTTGPGPVVTATVDGFTRDGFTLTPVHPGTHLASTSKTGKCVKQDLCFCCHRLHACIACSLGTFQDRICTASSMFSKTLLWLESLQSGTSVVVVFHLVADGRMFWGWTLHFVLWPSQTVLLPSFIQINSTSSLFLYTTFDIFCKTVQSFEPLKT